jgi:hypothetical protein
MQEYYVPLLEDDHDFDASRFSAFVELQVKRVDDSIKNAGFTKGDFAKWVNSGKLQPLNTVRILPRILPNPVCRQIFLAKGAKEAEKHLDIPAPESALKDASLEQLASQICRRINTLPYETLLKLKTEPEGDLADLLRTTRNLLDELCDDISAATND